MWYQRNLLWQIYDIRKWIHKFMSLAIPFFSRNDNKFYPHIIVSELLSKSSTCLKHKIFSWIFCSFICFVWGNLVPVYFLRIFSATQIFIFFKLMALRQLTVSHRSVGICSQNLVIRNRYLFRLFYGLKSFLSNLDTNLDDKNASKMYSYTVNSWIWLFT